MRLFLHVCCGPCAIAVLEYLVGEGHEVTGFFFNPNIMPLAEYLRRREGAVEVHAKLGLPLVLADTLPWDEQKALWGPNWGVEGGEGLLAERLASLPPAVHPAGWLRLMHLREYERCGLCWWLRLRATAMMAKKLGFDAMSSTLLYSRYQNHERIQQQSRLLAKAAGLDFFYHDFRGLWQTGIDRSKELGMYRQQYCGCVYSEYERYTKNLKAMLPKTVSK